jgi:periplasmic copper chaperone A
MMVLNLLSAFILVGSVSAASPPDVVFEDARAYLPMAGGRATAGYIEIKNASAQDAKVEIVSAEGFKAAEIHETYETDGKMSMRKIENLTVQSKGQDALVPGGKHIMLFDPTRKFKEGELIQVTLKVNDTTRKVPFKMVPRMSKEKVEAEHHHH